MPLYPSCTWQTLSNALACPPARVASATLQSPCCLAFLLLHFYLGSCCGSVCECVGGGELGWGEPAAEREMVHPEVPPTSLGSRWPPHSRRPPIPSLTLYAVLFDSSCLCHSTQQIQSCLDKMYLIYKQFKKSRMRPGEPFPAPPVICGSPSRAAGGPLRGWCCGEPSGAGLRPGPRVTLPAGQRVT